MLKNSQPIMQSTLYNQVLISLFTKNNPPWPGNLFIPEVNRIGSDFEETVKRPITASNLVAIENSCERAIVSPLTPQVRADVRNPKGDSLNVEIKIGAGSVTLGKVGAVWEAQKNMGTLV
ncbi:hypothetical protein FACS1894110_09980 [Spirochaetia bacterium]|nr:hypothetical protein FACS1894110_09980 [Spirochaetia bacterium]